MYNLWFVLLLIIATGFRSWGQIKSAISKENNTIIVRGLVIDSVQGKPIEYATVSIVQEAAQKPVFTNSGKNGFFEIIITFVTGKYTIVCSRLGYQAKSTIVDIKQYHAAVDIGKVFLPIASNSLKEVTITAKKSLVRQEIDKIIYDVTSDPEARSQNLFELIKKVPLISLSSDDQILLKGTQSYKVLLDGKPSLLVVSNPKDVFKTMPARLVEKIEIITVPPARYEAEGLVGIINIVTNKQLRGSNGGINSGYNRLYSILGGSYALREEKIGASVLGNLSLERQPVSPFSSYRLGISSVPLSTYESGSNEYTGKYVWGNALISYDLNALNLLTFTAGTNIKSSSRVSETSSQVFRTSGDLDQDFQLNRTTNNYETEYEAGINYQKGFKKKKDELFTASYKFSNIIIDKKLSTEITNLYHYNHPSFRQNNNSGIREQTLQADLVYPVKKNLLEAGIKMVSRDNYSEYSHEKFDLASSSYLNSNTNETPFDYKQTIAGVYGAYYLKFKKLGVKTNLRLEETMTDALFTSGNRLNDQYLNLLPAANATYILNKFTNLGLKYSRRIQRPAIWQLNPFVDESNPRFLTSGNPNLLPVNFNDIEVSLSRFKKGSINTSLTYSFAKNTIQNVLLYQQDTITISTYQNVGTNDNLSLNINFNYPLTSKISLNSSGKITYAWIQGVFSGSVYQNEGAQGHAYLYLTYKIKKTQRVSANGGFYSPSVLLQGKSNAYLYSSLNFYQEVLKGKGAFSFGINNPFQRYRFAINSFNTADFIQNNRNRNIYRTFSVNYNQRFGKIKELVKKNKRGINNDDIKRD